jgi:hypothetical protein
MHTLDLLPLLHALLPPEHRTAIQYEPEALFGEWILHQEGRRDLHAFPELSQRHIQHSRQANVTQFSYLTHFRRKRDAGRHSARIVFQKYSM